MNIPNNVGKIDRYLRIAVGAMLFILGMVFENWLDALGLLIIASAVLGQCPTYALLHVNPLSKKARGESFSRR